MSVTTNRRVLRVRAAAIVAAGAIATIAGITADPMAHSGAAAATTLSITPLGWNVVGLDSNDPSVGPNEFAVGARVCNTGAVAATNVVVDWTWTTTNAFVALAGPANITVPTLAAGACKPVYYSVVVTRSGSAYDTTRDFVIDAVADDADAVTTPTNRQIYVEHLISQNRNNIASLTGVPATAQIGDTLTWVLTGGTAPGGYEQFTALTAFDSSFFDVQSVSVTYTTPTGATNDQFYADACGWDPVVGSGTYRACVGPEQFTGGKAGGDPVVTTVVVKIIGAGTTSVKPVLYDFSGSSYHYKDDAAKDATIVITDPATTTTSSSTTSSTTTSSTSTSTTTTSTSTTSTTVAPTSTSLPPTTAAPTTAPEVLPDDAANDLPNTGGATLRLVAIAFGLTLIGWGLRRWSEAKA